MEIRPIFPGLGEFRAHFSPSPPPVLPPLPFNTSPENALCERREEREKREEGGKRIILRWETREGEGERKVFRAGSIRCAGENGLQKGHAKKGGKFD